MKRLFLVVLFALCSCLLVEAEEPATTPTLGSERVAEYIHLLEGRRVGVLANHTATREGLPLVDTLLRSGIDVQLIFASRPGFEGADYADGRFATSRDAYTGVEIVSLYGDKAAPRANDVFKCDVVVVDMVDVGVRTSPHLAVLYRTMQTCADVGVPMLLLDRPNPNDGIVDGPLPEEHLLASGALLPIPVVYGMTLGELARMINGEGWLKGGKRCALTVVPCLNYTRGEQYHSTLAPSPNLPNRLAVALYPSLCYFDATRVSVGRGTDSPFQLYGHPALEGEVEFTPTSREGARHPVCCDSLCYGRDLRTIPLDTIRSRTIDLSYLIEAHAAMVAAGEEFFTSRSLFDRLIGVGYVGDMVEIGYTAEEIKRMWRGDVERFEEQRRPYLIYD